MLKNNVSLAAYNTFGIKNKALWFSYCPDLATLKECLLAPQIKAFPLLILGGGSNILFTGDFKGVVLKIEIGGIQKIKEDSEYVWVKAGAGVEWHQLVMFCVEKGWQGIENLALIPGTVGAAPIQNIGAYGVELKDTFESLEAISVLTHEIKTFTCEDCKFGYRDSIFKNELKNKFVITSVTLRLNKNPKFNISYGSISDMLKAKGVSELSVKAISDAIIEIRQSKLPDPKVIGNCGSFFKNPEVSLSQFEKIKAQYPNIVAFPTQNQTMKLAAAWLIEQCGWKGKKVGNVGCYEKQALVIVNHGNASGLEAKNFAMRIKDSVFQQFNISLETEVNVI
ncbi:MAG: UDP-N-acetylmuramate dehydrogenase [Flammeovirgaceae bacterium]